MMEEKQFTEILFNRMINSIMNGHEITVSDYQGNLRKERVNDLRQEFFDYFKSGLLNQLRNNEEIQKRINSLVPVHEIARAVKKELLKDAKPFISYRVKDDIEAEVNRQLKMQGGHIKIRKVSIVVDVEDEGE